MMATMNGKIEAANALLEVGADVNLQSNDVSCSIAILASAVMFFNSDLRHSGLDQCGLAACICSVVSCIVMEV